MSGPTHDVRRRGNSVTVEIYNGRRNTQMNATDLARKVMQPWEVISGAAGSRPGRNRTGFWIFDIDPDRSAVRKAVIDTVIFDMDMADYGQHPDPGRGPGGSRSTRQFLRHLRETIEIIEDEQPVLRGAL